MSVWHRTWSDSGDSLGGEGYFYPPYYQELTAFVEVYDGKAYRTIKLPITIKADAIYTLFVMEQGNSVAGKGQGKVMYGNEAIPLREPYKVFEPTKLLSLPNQSKVVIRFIDGTAGLLHMDTPTLTETHYINLTKLTVEPMANITGFASENTWGASIHSFGSGLVRDEIIDQSLKVVLKKSKLVNPISFIIGFLADPERMGGSIIATRIRSEVGFSVSEDGDVTFANFAGTPEILRNSLPTLAVGVGQEVQVTGDGQAVSESTNIASGSGLTLLNKEMDEYLTVLNATSFKYTGANGLAIESYSKYWWSEEKLKALYRELMSNEHGSEMKELKGIKIFPDKGYFREKGRAAGYYVRADKEIHLNYGDFMTTVESMAKVLSHEYGHHYTIYNMKKKEGVTLGQTPLSKVPYYKARKLSGNPYVINGYNNGHAWSIAELAAEDYVQLLGSDTARMGYAQENTQLPPETEVPGLKSYFRSLSDLGVQVYIDGELLHTDVNARIINGRTLVPMRAIFERLGASVSWDGTAQTVTGAKDDISITLPIGKATAVKNGTALVLDVPAQIISGRTMVPVRFVAESLGCKVEYDGRVIITTQKGN